MSIAKDIIGEIRRAGKPLTVADLEQKLRRSGDALSSLLLRMTKEGTLTRKAGVGPRGGYGYDVAPDLSIGTKTAYDHILWE